MSVEHRWSQRKPVQLEGIIFHRPLGLLRCKVIDLGLNGARVDTGCITLPPHALVKLNFALDLGGKPRGYQVEAMIVHHRGTTRHGNQHGLMFKDFILKDFNSLLRTLIESAA